MSLIDCIIQKKGTGALVISAMLDFLTYALCPPFSETTDGEYFDALLGKKLNFSTYKDQINHKIKMT